MRNSNESSFLFNNNIFIFIKRSSNDFCLLSVQVEHCYSVMDTLSRGRVLDTFEYAARRHTVHFCICFFRCFWAPPGMCRVFLVLCLVPSLPGTQKEQAPIDTIIAGDFHLTPDSNLQQVLHFRPKCQQVNSQISHIPKNETMFW